MSNPNAQERVVIHPDRNFIIFDVETTGIPKPDAAPLGLQPQIIEYAGLKVDFNTLEIKDSIEFLVNPGAPLPKDIIKITGLTDEILKPQLPFSSYFQDLSDFHLGVEGLISHNLAFDHALIRFELMKLGMEFHFPWSPVNICTVEATVHLKGHRLKLEELHELATGETQAGKHRAMDDTKALLECVKWMRGKGLL